MDATLENTLKEGKLRRQINALIVAHLRGENLNQAAAAVASATMTSLNTEVSPNRLLELVSKGLVAERDEGLKGLSSTSLLNVTGGLPSMPNMVNAIDFSAMQDVKGSSKNFPKHESKHVSEHKNIARCARFSPDGQFVATGSSDYSIKLLEVSKIKQMMVSDAREGPIRPVIRTFYDHAENLLDGIDFFLLWLVKPQILLHIWLSRNRSIPINCVGCGLTRAIFHLPINDLDFHPQGTILVSGAKDNTIKFFDFSKTVARKAFRVIQDTHNVRSVSFHPSGEFLLAGTDHHLPHLYDVNTFQCYLSSNFQDLNIISPINQVRYSISGSLYVTASKDGSVLLWDGVTAQCIRKIVGAHGLTETTCATFTKDQRFVLSCGKDSTIKLWEVGTGRLVKQYLGAVHTQLRCQAVFNETEEFVLSIDEPNNEVVIWDALTAEKVARWHSNHIGVPRWLQHSPTEAAFITCGTDRSVRYWKEVL